MSLSGKVALVTGAAQGIGKTIALCLAKDGADMVISDLNLEGAETTANEIQKLGRRALAVKTDVSKAVDVEEMVQKVIDKFGQIDILVNNAGVTRDTLLMRMKEADWDFVLNINLKGTFNCTKEVIRWMMKQKKGKIVNVSSVVGVMGNVGQANYAASKAGVIGFTKTVAREVAPRGINVNAVAPGFIDTEMTKVIPDKAKQMLLSQIPLGKLGMPEDVANVVRFLASEEANYITGQTIHVNGGMFM